MNIRAGLIGVVIAACFVAANMVGGCSGGNDGGTDGGNTTGTTDGGSTTKTDGGSTTQTSGVGAACSGTGQGTCQTGLECRTDLDVGGLAFVGGYCTKSCTAAADCGSNGASANICGQIGDEQLCARACDPTATDSCSRAGYMCVPASQTDTHKGLCVPDCRASANAGLCETGQQCNQTTGFCERIPGDKKTGESCNQDTNDCIADNDCLGTTVSNGQCFVDCAQTGKCGTGEVCVGLDSTGQTAICMKNCDPAQANTCGTGLECIKLTGGTGTASGGCFVAEPPPGNVDQSNVCEPRTDDVAKRCKTNLECVPTSQQTNNGVCMGVCTDDPNVCTNGSSCIDLSQPNQPLKLCLTKCGAAGQTCPTGTQCAQIGSGDKVCIAP